MKKATNIEIAKLFGYAKNTFTEWKKDATLRKRFKALKIMATLEKNGVEWEELEEILNDYKRKIDDYESRFRNVKAFIDEKMEELTK